MLLTVMAMMMMMMMMMMRWSCVLSAVLSLLGQ